MSAICKCDWCGQLDGAVPAESELCRECQSRSASIHAHAQDKLRQEFRDQFGAVVEAQVAVVRLCKYLRDEKPDKWRKAFGTQGESLLMRALSDEPREAA